MFVTQLVIIWLLRRLEVDEQFENFASGGGDPGLL